MALPRALRCARAGYDYRTPAAPLGIYARGPANAPRDIHDALRGHRQIDHSTTASSIAAIADAATRSKFTRRG